MQHGSFDKERHKDLLEILRKEYRKVVKVSKLPRHKLLALTVEPLQNLILMFMLEPSVLEAILEDDEIIEFLHSDNDKEPLKWFLMEGFDFLAAARDNGHSVEDIVRRYKENKLHLDMMMAGANAHEAVCCEFHRYDIVAFGLECYDIDVDSIAAELAEDKRKVFEANVKRYMERDEEQETESEDEEE